MKQLAGVGKGRGLQLPNHQALLDPRHRHIIPNPIRLARLRLPVQRMILRPDVALFTVEVRGRGAADVSIGFDVQISGIVIPYVAAGSVEVD
jgi:hypothetical protein